MWRGTRVDTHYYSKAPGSLMNITCSSHPASLTDGPLAGQREGLSCFPSLIDFGGSPSIKCDRLSTSVNRAQQLFRKTGGSLAPERLSASRPHHMNSERHIIGFEHILTTERSYRLHLISHSKSKTANTRTPLSYSNTELSSDKY